MTTGAPAFRGWQEEALATVQEAWRNDASAKVLVAACPGAGKTFFTGSLIRVVFRDDKIKLAIIVAPTTNIQWLWVDELESLGLKVNAATNPNLDYRRRESNNSMTDGWQVIVLTYAQLARDAELIVETARRAEKTLLCGDEIHHADDDKKYGESIGKVADHCVHTLALSGTPFNSEGGALALCDFDDDVDDSGKPIRRTLPTYSYSYGQAITDCACRKVEFIKVYGRGKSTYRSLLNQQLIKRIIDLAAENKSDTLSALLDPHGVFMEECAIQAIKSLVDLRAAGDMRAAMLVVAKDKKHGAALTQLLERISKERGQKFFIQQIYNDTPRAHERVENLVADTTDIVVSVRMISEGVNVKRLRVGMYATDWMTRMFFIQFVGRFVRHEDRLDKDSQFAWVIIPAHITLLTYALEIEKMIEAAALPGEGNGGGGEKKWERIDNETEAGEKGVISRGEESNDIALSETFFKKYPSLKGKLGMLDAIKAAQEAHMEGSFSEKPQQRKPDWSKLNDQLIVAVAKRLEIDGDDQSDEGYYGFVQTAANQAVGISRKDGMTTEDVLIKRHAFLKDWLLRLRGYQDQKADAQP